MTVSLLVTERFGHQSNKREWWKNVGSDLAEIEKSDLTEHEESAKRRQIMEGAREVFLSQGFDAASMGKIARKARVSKGTLYVYFDSKERLFEALRVHDYHRDQGRRSRYRWFRQGVLLIWAISVVVGSFPWSVKR
jgi:Bacterial regulatory proteins, tetR family